MKIYLLKKERGRIYRSADIIHFIGNEYYQEEWTLIHDALGAPKLSSSEKDSSLPCVSISDTSYYWAAAVSGSPVGIDMEEKRRRPRKSAVRALHPLEQQYLSGLEPESSEWALEFLRIWTFKEASMKKDPELLRRGPKAFPVLTEEGMPVEGLRSLGVSEPVILSVCSEDADTFDTVRINYSGAHEQTALEKAAQLLGDRAYSASALTRKLTDRGYSKEEACGAVSELRERGYIDDEQYAADYVRRAREAGKGKLRIMRELSLQGIAPETIKDALENAQQGGLYVEDAAEEPESEFDRALSAAMRITKGKETDDKTKARVARKLSSLGYEASVIWSVLDSLG